MNRIIAQLGMLAALPEPVAYILAALAGAFGAFWLNRVIWSDTERKTGEK